MAKEKAQKTNAMRMLDRAGVSYRVNYYDCDEFIDGVHIADQLGQPYEQTFKTLVATGKSGAYYVFVIPVAETLDLKKAAKAVGEKSVELLHVKDIRAVTGYIRGGCTPIGMKKQYPTVIHRSALEFNELILSGGCLGAQIFLAPADLVRVTGAKTEDLLLEN